MWASNLPVEKLMCPVADQIASLEQVMSGLNESEMDMIFRQTAKRVYNMNLRN